MQDAPAVGENLQDHMQVRMTFRCKKPITVNDSYHHPVRRLGMGLRYLLHRSGPLTVSAGYAAAFYRTSDRVATPDVEVHFITLSTDKMGEALHRHPGFTASVCQLRPESVGNLRIRSPDPLAAPAIRANDLASETDRQTTVDGLKVLRAICHAPAMRDYTAEEIEPGPAVSRDADLLSYCRARGSTLYHPVSSCIMGPDERSVVTPQLKVRGADGLRVVDGSVMPRLVSANCNAAIVMIGEKASDMILADAG